MACGRHVDGDRQRAGHPAQVRAPGSGPNLSEIRASIDALNLTTPPYTPADDPTSRDLPEQDAFRVRVVVCAGTACPADVDYDPSVAIEQRQYFARSDATLLPKFPVFLQGHGAASPAFADLDGDAKDELVIADGNGFVHVYNEDGSEAGGWPIHTSLDRLPRTGTNGYTARRSRTGSTRRSSSARRSWPTWTATATWRSRSATSRATSTCGTPTAPRAGSRFAASPRSPTSPAARPGRADCDDYSPNDVKNQHNTVDQASPPTPRPASWTGVRAWRSWRAPTTATCTRGTPTGRRCRVGRS